MGTTMDKVPIIGHAKGLIHHAMGEHDRAGQALDTANGSVSMSLEYLRMAYNDIASPENMPNGNDGEHPEHPEVAASYTEQLAGALTPTEISRSTLRFIVTPDQ